MPDMDSVYRDGQDGQGSVVRLAAALGLVFAGAAVLATGLAGVLSSWAGVDGSPAGAAVAAVLVPTALAIVLTAVPATRQQRVAGAAGVALALLGVLTAWAIGAPTPDWAPLPVPAIAGAVAGTGIAAAALVTAAATDGGQRAVGDAMPGYVTGAQSRTQHGPRAGLPADGGTEDDDLSFPLDDEQ